MIWTDLKMRWKASIDSRSAALRSERESIRLQISAKRPRPRSRNWPTCRSSARLTSLRCKADTMTWSSFPARCARLPSRSTKLPMTFVWCHAVRGPALLNWLSRLTNLGHRSCREKSIRPKPKRWPWLRYR